MQSADAGIPVESTVARPRERPVRQSNWRGLRRVPLFALGLALPSLAALGFLIAAGQTAPLAGLLAVVVIFVLLALFVAPLVSSLAAVQATIEAIGADSEPGAEAGATRRLGKLTGTADGIWQAAARLAREWRERCTKAEARLGAAEAVFAAIPDPQILLDRQRRVVRANPAAGEFVG